ncbi:hypothetical protein AaE_013444, partial [Aphanomyces astaci]
MIAKAPSRAAKFPATVATAVELDVPAVSGAISNNTSTPKKPHNAPNASNHVGACGFRGQNTNRNHDCAVLSDSFGSDSCGAATYESPSFVLFCGGMVACGGATYAGEVNRRYSQRKVWIATSSRGTELTRRSESSSVVRAMLHPQLPKWMARATPDVTKSNHARRNRGQNASSKWTVRSSYTTPTNCKPDVSVSRQQAIINGGVPNVPSNANQIPPDDIASTATARTSQLDRLDYSYIPYNFPFAPRTFSMWKSLAYNKAIPEPKAVESTELVVSEVAPKDVPETVVGRLQKVLEYLNSIANHAAVTVPQIYQKTGIDLASPGEYEVCERVRNNPKVRIEGDKFAYKAKFDIKTRADVLRQLNR